jgi:hypothetical protein
MMKTAEQRRQPWIARLLYRLPHSVFRWLALSRMSAEAYGSAAPADAAARDMQVLAEERFTMRGVAAQAAAIATYRCRARIPGRGRWFRRSRRGR